MPIIIVTTITTTTMATMPPDRTDWARTGNGFIEFCFGLVSDSSKSSGDFNVELRSHHPGDLHRFAHRHWSSPLLPRRRRITRPRLDIGNLAHAVLRDGRDDGGHMPDQRTHPRF